MTKEEALSKVKGYLTDLLPSEEYGGVEEIIKALEQEPCEDSVSRSEVKKIAKEMYLEVANMKLDVTTISDCISYTSSKCREVLERKLQTLPSVTPTISEIDKFNDSVNRATVLALINDVKNADGFKDYSQYEYLFDQVDKMPMSAPTQKWIPVKEQLPEESLNSVIGWDAYRERCVFVQYINGYFQITGSDESFNIVAWMPLPDDYKEEKESEQLLSYADQDTMQPAT